MQFQSNTYWLACNPWNVSQLTDAFTGQALILPQGTQFELRCCGFQGDPSKAASLVNDLSNLTSVTLFLFADNASGASLGTFTVSASSFNNPSCTYANWSAQTDWQFGFVLPPSATNWSPGASGWDNNIYFEIFAQAGIDPIRIGLGYISYQATGLNPGASVTSYSTTSQYLQVMYNVGLFPGLAYPLLLAAPNALTGAAVTQETGGTTSCLDHIDLTASFGPLTSLPVGFCLSFVSATGLQNYVVSSGTVTPGPGVVCNPNYNSSTQPKYLQQI